MERGREGGERLNDLEMGMGMGERRGGRGVGEVGEAEGWLALPIFNSLTDAAPFPPLSQRDLLDPRPAHPSELVP